MQYMCMTFIPQFWYTCVTKKGTKHSIFYDKIWDVQSVNNEEHPLLYFKSSSLQTDVLQKPKMIKQTGSGLVQSKISKLTRHNPTPKRSKSGPNYKLSLKVNTNQPLITKFTRPPTSTPHYNDNPSNYPRKHNLSISSCSEPPQNHCKEDHSVIDSCNTRTNLNHSEEDSTNLY